MQWSFAVHDPVRPISPTDELPLGEKLLGAILLELAGFGTVALAKRLTQQIINWLTMWDNGTLLDVHYENPARLSEKSLDLNPSVSDSSNIH